MLTPKRLRFRTIFIPLIMMFIHMIVLSSVSEAYSRLYPLISRFAQSIGQTNWAIYDTTEKLIITEYPRIAVISALGLIPLYAIILIFRKLNQADSIWIRRMNWSEIWPTLTIAGGLIGLTNLLFGLIQLLGGQFPVVERAMTDYLSSAEAFSPSIGYVWLTLGIAILAPISEELLFRGIIQGELRRAMPEWVAVVVQAILFAVFHAQPIQIAYVMIPALALGALYAITRTIWAPIILHIAFNFLGSVVPAAVGNDATLLQIVSLTEMAFIVVGGLAFATLVVRSRAH
ncbi:MAG: CPBP family intramembrane metalloprotease [Eubacteriales bacterium]|nr:CPBP family intramembrane metalloprotease [Eubacteriales bacterium]